MDHQQVIIDGFRVSVRSEPHRAHKTVAVQRIGDGGGCVATGRINADGSVQVEATAWLPDALISRALEAMAPRPATIRPPAPPAEPVELVELEDVDADAPVPPRRAAARKARED
jgi:hypothetical protein